MTEVCDDSGMPDAKVGISSLKRVNSANNLTIPGNCNLLLKFEILRFILLTHYALELIFRNLQY